MCRFLIQSKLAVDRDNIYLFQILADKQVLDNYDNIKSASFLQCFRGWHIVSEQIILFFVFH